MIWFNEEKRFGFIRTEEGERLYVRESGFLQGDVPVGRCGGIMVSFLVAGAPSVEGGFEAVQVSVVDEAPTRRARPHSHSRS